MCGIDYINILCKYLTEGSVYLQHNVMLYIQKSVSENAGNCSHRGRKIQKFSGGEYPQTPPTLNAIPHQTFCYQQTIYLSFLYARYSMVPFCRCPPTDEFLKNALFSQWLPTVACAILKQLTRQPMKEDFKRYVDQITQNVIALLHICHLKNLNQDQSYRSCSENKKIALRCRIASGVCGRALTQNKKTSYTHYA